MNGDKHYHGELKVTIGGNEARINIFADNLQQLFADLGTVHAQFGKADVITSPARREIANAEEIARRQKVTKGADSPVCPNCATDRHMELIEFTDRKTGELKKAWKCQECQKWFWPAKNGEGA